MENVVNNPPSNGEGSSGMGVVVGVILTIVVVVLFVIYGLPRLRGSQAPAEDNGSVDINVTLPAGNNNPPSEQDPSL